MLRSKWSIIVFNILILMMYQISDAFDIKDIEISSREIYQGDVFYLKFRHSGVEIDEVYFRGNRLALFTDSDGDKVAIAGVDMDAEPGVSGINIFWKGNFLSIPVEIKKRVYKMEMLSISEKPLNDEIIKRIDNEREKLLSLFSKITPQKYWEGSFILPANGSIVKNFGSRRIINGLERQPHSGIDIKGMMGDDVVASNRGIVCFTGDLYFAGKSVVIDHGFGIFTMYFHLSDVTVNEGMMVEKGDVIGKIGSSGRATGSHLHFGVRILNARVDPLSLIKEQMR